MSGAPSRRQSRYLRNASRRWPRFFRVDPLVWRAWPFTLLLSLPRRAPVASSNRPRSLSTVPPALSRPLLLILNSLLIASVLDHCIPATRREALDAGCCRGRRRERSRSAGRATSQENIELV